MVHQSLMTDEHAVKPLACFLTACEIERRELRSGRRERKVVNGRRIFAESGRFFYSFDAPVELNLKEDTSIQLVVGGAFYHGTIHHGAVNNNSSHAGEVPGRSSGSSLESETKCRPQRNKLTVAIQADLGSEIASARIEGEEQDLLQVLITRLRAIKSDGGANGWHQEIAHKVIDLKRHEQTQSALFDVSKFPEDLTADQMNALGRCLSQPVTYLWGPPGTGKTVTLAALALQLFKENKRVLVVSHTNHAVDGVVESLCRRIVDRGRNALPEGTILRVGTLVKESLIQRFGDQVHLESVMNHSHDKVSSRLDALKRELAQVRDRLFSVTRKITLLDSRDQLLRELDRIRKEVKGIDTGFVSAVKRVFQPESGGGGLDEQLTEESGESVALLQTHVMQLSAEIEGCDRQSLVDESVELSNRQVEMVEAIALLEKFMRDLRVSLLDRARIIATTATHAMLSERELRGFDAVLIDEASMLPLPLCFLLSGLAKERVVVAGDFRQLPAIATSDSHMVQQWYSRDVFDCAGVIDLVDAQGAHPALVTLTTQFRSSEVLCSLVNGRFYGGILETDAAVDADRYIFKEPLAYLNRYPVVLVDTSSLEPFGEVQFGSKSNLLHALLVRKIALLLSGSGAVVDRGAVGVISPYRRQANLIRDLLEECRLGDLISVGSVHKFQGSERDSIIFDLTESSPHSLGSFFSAVSLRDTGARLLNVALSRARRHLFVVANFEHLRNRLSSRHIMWHVLDDLCRIGYQLPVDELIGEAILTNSPQEVQSAPGILPFQCFDEQLFMPGLVTDLLEATNEVVFSSPTCTTQVTRVMKSILEQRVQNGLRVTVWIDGTRQISGETEAALRELRGVGVIVLRSRGPVPPVAVIDSEVAWLGSIAPLDAIAPAEGLMTRCVSDRAAYHALELLEPATPVAQEEQLLASA